MTALVWQGTAHAPSYYTCNLFWPVAKLVSLRTLRFWARWKVFVPQTRSSASCLLGRGAPPLGLGPASITRAARIICLLSTYYLSCFFLAIDRWEGSPMTRFMDGALYKYPD